MLAHLARRCESIWQKVFALPLTSLMRNERPVSHCQLQMQIVRCTESCSSSRRSCHAFHPERRPGIQQPGLPVHDGAKAFQNLCRL